MKKTVSFILIGISLSLSGCVRSGGSRGGAAGPREAALSSAGMSFAPFAVDPCTFILLPLEGQGKIDREIQALQKEVEKAARPALPLERLGWLLVAKARLSFDPGYYKLAEACALCLEAKEPGSQASSLLRGHVLTSLHRFKEAELLGRELVRVRGGSFDHGLLGDALMEEGRLAEAAEAYQKMLDLKPCLQSYSRGAHLRWLRGDLPGARELMRLAVQAGSARDPESLAWACSRLALYELQAGDGPAGLRACEAALRLLPDHAPALLARGRILLARGDPAAGLEALKRAAELNPLPEYQWTLADALLEAGRGDEARAVESRLEETGAAADPRTFALYLATRGKELPTALSLSEKELSTRSDVFTHDARGWALLQAGRPEAAGAAMEAALAEGTEDARLFFHAGVHKRALGKTEEARRWLGRSEKIEDLLLPSERSRLRKEISEL
jgi:tetratricopeptide (TPR) repeat protein